MKWHVDPVNDDRLYFLYADYLSLRVDDNEMYNGTIPFDLVKDSVDQLMIVLSKLNIIWAVDTGFGEPAIWLNKQKE